MPSKAENMFYAKAFLCAAFLTVFACSLISERVTGREEQARYDRAQESAAIKQYKQLSEDYLWAMSPKALAHSREILAREDK